MSMIQPGAPAPAAPVEQAPVAPVAPAVPDPAAPPAAPVEPTQQQQVEQRIHPAWEAAMAAVPDLLRGPLVEQIRVSEREHQAAIEQARTGSVPPAWQQFVTEAQAAGATPEQIVDAYNYAKVIREDPVTFSINLNNAIDDLIKDGRLTAKEGYRMKQEGQQQVQAVTAQPLDPNDPLLTPEQKLFAQQQKELAELKESVEKDRQTRLTEQQQMTEQQQAEAYANDFVARLEAAVPGDPTAPAVIAARQMIGRAADSMLASAAPGSLTVDQALAQVVKQAGTLGLNLANLPQVAAAATATTQTPPPVGTGTASAGAPAKPTLTDDRAGKDARAALMMAAAKASIGEGAIG